MIAPHASPRKTLLWSSISTALGDKGFSENKTQFIGQYAKQINLKDYPKAIYYLEIETFEGVINKKLIFQ